MIECVVFALESILSQVISLAAEPCNASGKEREATPFLLPHLRGEARKVWKEGVQFFERMACCIFYYY